MCLQMVDCMPRCFLISWSRELQLLLINSIRLVLAPRVVSWLDAGVPYHSTFCTASVALSLDEGAEKVDGDCAPLWRLLCENVRVQVDGLYSSLLSFHLIKL
jgi:hypothetical protein